MIVLWLFVWLLATTSAFAVVIDPKDALVRIKIGKVPICVGTILNSRWIITTAKDCVYQEDKLSVVVKGQTSEIKVEKSVIHPSLDTVSYFNNIALLKTETEIKFGAHVDSIPIDNTYVLENSQVTVLGFDPKNETTDLVVKTQTLSRSTCEHLLQKDMHFALSKELLCTFTEKGANLCKWHMGGPIILNEKLVGVASWFYENASVKDCGLLNPDAAIRLSEYKDWIENNIKS